MTEEQLQKRRENWRRYYNNHPEKQVERRKKSQQSNCDFIDSFKVCCAKCGINDKRVLDFHHIDESTKLFTLASRRVAGYKKSTILEEIQKCEILCANCHRKEHIKEI